MVMIIRDFDVTVEYEPDEAKIISFMKNNNLTEKEATKEYIAKWKTVASSFKFQTRCTASMFRRVLGKRVKADCRKIVVECVENITDMRTINYTGIRTIQMKYNYHEFFSLKPLEKKKKTLELLMEGIQKIADLLHWDMTPFKQAYEEIIIQGYQNHWIWKKIRSPNRDMTAELWIFHEIDSVDLVLVVRDKKGVEICREHIISDKPDELIFDNYLGAFQWENNSRITLIAKSPEMRPDASYTGNHWTWSFSTI